MERQKIHFPDNGAVETNLQPEATEGASHEPLARERKISPQLQQGCDTNESQNNLKPKRAHKVTPTIPSKPQMVPVKETPHTEPESQSRSTGAQVVQPVVSTTEPTGQSQPMLSTTEFEYLTGAGRARKKEPWEQRFARVTWYVERNRLSRVWRICELDDRSLTNVVNAALEEYLQRHYENRK